jgi:hypothetical protein
MRTSRQLAILGATVASAMTLASLVTPTPASAAPRDRGGLQPLTNVLQPVDGHDSEWVTIRWTTDRPVCHVRVQMHGGRDADFAYPNDRGYTSFSKGEGLRPGRIDYTSFRVTPNGDGPVTANGDGPVTANGDGPDWVFLTATVTYDYCRWESPTLNDAIGFWLPVRA